MSSFSERLRVEKQARLDAASRLRAEEERVRLLAENAERHKQLSEQQNAQRLLREFVNPIDNQVRSLLLELGKETWLKYGIEFEPVSSVPLDHQGDLYLAHWMVGNMYTSDPSGRHSIPLGFDRNLAIERRRINKESIWDLNCTYYRVGEYVVDGTPNFYVASKDTSQKNRDQYLYRDVQHISRDVPFLGLEDALLEAYKNGPITDSNPFNLDKGA